jgi:hypothetical protein
MGKCLLSIDWDYFIYTRYNWGLYAENSRSLIDLWYKRYIQGKARGEDIQKAFHLSSDLDTFWSRIKKYFKFVRNIKAYVSDSHALSYKIAKGNDCETVYLFDSHADLGYGGLSSLNYEVNCSNWLGKILKENQIKEANIFYSPHTAERPGYFKQMNSIYNIRYYDFNDFNGSDECIAVSAIHICRSGAWTPPWLDDEFTQFVDALGVAYKIVNCPERKWNPVNINLSDQINYLLA